jgi:hypothetical protein
VFLLELEVFSVVLVVRVEVFVEQGFAFRLRTYSWSRDHNRHRLTDGMRRGQPPICVDIRHRRDGESIDADTAR